ncbi:MAG: class I SAM-dependent RNA methyltransferase [Nocardioidaceae bacterium]
MTAPVPAELAGSEVVLDVGPVAHGGHCVARWDGRVVFVRHSLPGETVRVRVTEGTESSRFVRADAIEVLRPSPGRVEAPCPYAGPGLCGGCDWQHATPATQRELLGAVVAEQLARLAGIEREVVVEAVAPEDLGWRTRLGWTVDAQGRPGLHRHRSHDVLPVDRCLIAAPDLPDAHTRTWSAGHVDVAVSSLGDTVLLADGDAVQGRARVRERVHERDFRVSAAGFWQVHPAAARTLVDAVLSYGRPAPGERVADLYAGVGLFSAFLGDAVAADGSVLAVEGDPRAVKDARRNLHDLPQVRIEAGRVGDMLARLPITPLDLVVLDPPRAGARAAVVGQIAARAPSRVVYVACDPAALARDIATFTEQGYALSDLRAFALFPMTHHVECVALLTRG